MIPHRTFRPDIKLPALTGRRFTKGRSLAAKLSVCPRTLFRWADAGQITRHKTNARVKLFDESEVAAIVVAARVPLSVAGTPSRKSTRSIPCRSKEQ